MIQAHIYGGLGNQLFQYATAKNLSILNNTNLYLCLDWFCQDFKNTTARNFDLDFFKVSYKETRGCIPRLYSKIYKPMFYNEKSPFEYDSSLLNLRGRNIWLNGYWGNYKYFDNIRDILLEELQPTEINEANRVLLSKIREVNSVSLHIRRGDYMSNELFMTLDTSYYSSAVDYIKKHIDNPVFFVFSDDIQYCKETFTGDEFCMVDLNKGKDSYLDLFLMSQCKHNIIANSTFSWWGAYLNKNENKTVIVPRKWYNEESSLLAGVKEKKRLNNNYPPSWIII